ncbi:MAG: methyltransferase domain-containing protein [Chloroflexota bacterium]
MNKLLPIKGDDSKLSGENFNYQKAPGYWVLARMGKRVLRPGGLQLTKIMLNNLNIQLADHVVEFAPGLGATAKLALENHPASYTAVEQDKTAVNQVNRLLTGSNQQCIVGKAEDTGLPDSSATAIFPHSVNPPPCHDSVTPLR